MILFLSSGLFLGWSLGANNAANVFGTAVGTRMLRFEVAAATCSIFVILGATIGGAGAAHTLGELGSVNALAGAFMVALAAALTVLWMTRLELPVSTSQAIVGAIIGWNFFSGSLTDYDSLTKIVLTWVVCPFLSALFAIGLFLALRAILGKIKLHLLQQDFYTRLGLWVVGAFGAYSLGANNIANVMGVFVDVVPFHALDVFGVLSITPAQQLFFLGSVAIAVGVYTYSHKVMQTVGSSLFKMSPEAALVVVAAQAMVLFLFSSETLESWLIGHGLPPIPLVPVSSSQAVVGAIIGIGILKGIKGIRYRMLGEIAVGWVTTPIIAGVIAFVSLFFLQNVFNQQVREPTTYRISPPVVEYLREQGIPVSGLQRLQKQTFQNQVQLDRALKRQTSLNRRQRRTAIEAATVQHYYVDPVVIEHKLDTHWLSREQVDAVQRLSGQSFVYGWQLLRALETRSVSWRLQPPVRANHLFNKELRRKREYVLRVFRLPATGR